MKDHEEQKVLQRNIFNLSELKNIMEEVRKLHITDKSILLLTGDLGAGKTTSIRILMELLGVSHQQVASPSFALHHHYKTSNGLNIDHFDLYRLEDQDDLESTGFWDVFATELPTLIAIEWADRLNWDYLPLDWKQIHLHFILVPSGELDTPSHREVTLFSKKGK